LLSQNVKITVVCCALAALTACPSASAPGSPDAAQPGGSDSGSAGPDAATPDAGSSGGADAGSHFDAGTPDSGSGGVDSGTTRDAGAGCGAFVNDTVFTCSADGTSRARCIGGTTLDQEACPRGCLREPSGTDSVCLGPADSDTFDCSGSYGLTRTTDGDYYLTSFGCWVDPQSQIHTDPGDNCIPSCLSQARASGLCLAGDDGPTCEERINWFTADGARFGCLARVRVTNPANGKSVIAVALDYGPACSVEQSVSEEVFDASGRVDLELFGGDQGASDHALVHVVEVDPSTPLGPVP
jgi:hypothetical protein